MRRFLVVPLLALAIVLVMPTVPSAAAPPVGAALGPRPAGSVIPVYVTWWDFGSSNIFFDWSWDRGVTWHTDARVNDVDGSARQQGNWRLAIPAMVVDQNSGAIYIAWPDSRNGDQDIYMASSTDGGLTWSTNHRVNDDTGPAAQWMVDLAVDSRGVVHAAWEDNRNSNWNIFYSNSSNSGSIWTTNLRVSDANTSGSYTRPGDYFALEVGPSDAIYVVWTDGRGADFDIFFALNDNSGSPPFSPNVDIIDGSSPYAWQVEPTMVINSAGQIFVGWKETTGPEAAGLRVGFSYSTDNGATFAPNILMNQTHSGQGCANSDPWMALAPDQRVYYAYLEFNCASGMSGLTVPNTTNGQDWGTLHYIQGTGGLVDKDSIWMEPAGRLYAGWDEGNVMAVTWTDDGGATWKTPFVDPDDGPGGVLGVIVATGPPVTVAAVTITTNPAGLVVMVDGSLYRTPATYTWVIGSSHAVAALSPIASGASARYNFTSWSDGGAQSHTIVATGDSTLTAAYTLQYRATLSLQPAGPRILVDSVPYFTDATLWWNANSTHTLDAPSPQLVAPDDRYVWASWSDGGARSHTVVANAPVIAVATFQRERTLALATSPTGLRVLLDGTAYTAPATFWFRPGDTHTVSVDDIQPGATGVRYVFVDWSDGGAATHVITFSGTMSLTATFRTEYLLTVSSPVSGATPSTWYAAGSTATASVSTAISDLGSGDRLKFTGWSGDATGTGMTSNAITMNGPKTATALYEHQFFLNVQSQYGSTTGSAWYASGTTAHAVVASLVVDVSTGTRRAFVSWSGAASGTGASSDAIAMDGPKTAVATWRTEYLVTIQSDVAGVQGGGWYPAGSSATITAPGQGTLNGQTVSFAGWSGDVSSQSASISVTVDRPITARAAWAAAGPFSSPVVTGGILGAIVIIAIAAVAFVVLRRRRRNEEP